nr:MAG TPA: hypothetical protein [Bacteriophage sp.]
MTFLKMYRADSCCGYLHYSTSTIAINSIII